MNIFHEGREEWERVERENMYRRKVKEIYMQEEEGDHPIIFYFLFFIFYSELGEVCRAARRSDSDR